MWLRQGLKYKNRGFETYPREETEEECNFDVDKSSSNWSQKPISELFLKYSFSLLQRELTEFLNKRPSRDQTFGSTNEQGTKPSRKQEQYKPSSKISFYCPSFSDQLNALHPLTSLSLFTQKPTVFFNNRD